MSKQEYEVLIGELREDIAMRNQVIHSLIDGIKFHSDEHFLRVMSQSIETEFFK